MGYSVQKHHVSKLPEIKQPIKTRKYLVADSIIGWADAVKELLKSYFFGERMPVFDFSDIRPKGALLITSGGQAPGPEPLKDMLHNIKKILDRKKIGDKLTTIECHDILCYIAQAVLAGGIRRSAMIAGFNLDDESMLTSKFNHWWELNPQRALANNSAIVLRHKIKKPDFKILWEKIEASRSGEPGIFFTNDKNTFTNPCAEISLSENGFCNLTEINGSDIQTQAEFNARAIAAAFIGTLQASYTDFHYLRENWKITAERESLLGVSITGIANKNFLKLNFTEASELTLQENARVAKLIGINKAYRINTVKPAGCRPSDALVTTNKGILMLEELLENHEVNKKWCDIKNIEAIQTTENKKILKSFHNGKANIFKIKTSLGIEIESTDNHPWFIKSHINKYKNHQTEEKINKFIKTSDLKKDDVLDINIGVYNKTESSLLKKENRFKTFFKGTPFTLIKQPDKLNEELCWLLGYLWGDGTMSICKYRIRFIDQYQNHLIKVQKIIKKYFDLDSNIKKCNDRNAYTLEVGSHCLWQWLMINEIYKYENEKDFFIPRIIRESSKNDIIAFISGIVDSDGCVFVDKTYKQNRLILTTASDFFSNHLQHICLSVGLAFGRSLNKQGNNLQKTKHIWLMQLSLSNCNKDSLNVLFQNSEKCKNIKNDYFNNIPKRIYKLGVIKSIELVGEKETFDVSVENEWFYAGAIKSHNTTSLVLGCSSGIHAWYAKYYIRRMRLSKSEPLYKYLKRNIPELIEDDFLKPEYTAILSIPQAAPEGAILRNESPLDLLERVKKIKTEWIAPSHRKGSNMHNVSVTVNIKDNEWADVGEWMWDNREIYNGISVLPYDNGTYKQAPFEECTKEKFESLCVHLKKIDLTKVKEQTDSTDLKGELACSGNSCEII